METLPSQKGQIVLYGKTGKGKEFQSSPVK